jgi:hypothetical protein
MIVFGAAVWIALALPLVGFAFRAVVYPIGFACLAVGLVVPPKTRLRQWKEARRLADDLWALRR